MLWIKSFHIIAIVAWFAGLFYLPRLFVYHAQAEDKISRDRFCTMERRLYLGIMTPSLVVVFILGFLLVGFNPNYYFASVWFHIKLALALLLLIYHLRCGTYMRRFAKEQAVLPSVRFFRWFNEVPTLVLVIIVLLVEIQPVIG